MSTPTPELYVRYRAMNSGKSTALLQAEHNYEERGHKPSIDTKGDLGILSRLGVEFILARKRMPTPSSSGTAPPRWPSPVAT